MEPDHEFSTANPAVRSTASLALSFSPLPSARIQNMMQRRSEFASQLEFEIEASKVHWSELESEVSVPDLAHADGTDSKMHQFQILTRFRRTLGRLLYCWHCANCGAFACGVLSCGAVFSSRHQAQQHQGNSHECVELEEAEDSDAEETNREIFIRIKHQWGGFFSEKWGHNLELGPKIAEGGQAEIFEVEGGGLLDSIRMEFVVKAFKKGYSLRSLQTQYPLGTTTAAPHFPLVNPAIIFAGTILEDDRFAFVMYKYWGDLRKLLDVTMASRPPAYGAPFPEPQSVSIMLQIAKGMELLHYNRILHRDLKASNILIASDMRKERKPPNPTPQSFPSAEFTCAIADYECSVGVIGTGFWRAPEILAAVRDRNPSSSMMFTDKADVYSFAMTCYEILTGCVPFETLAATDSEAVLRGLRPQLPHPMNSRITELLCRCWHSNPAERPSFPEIVLVLETVLRSYDLANPNSSPASLRST